MAEPFNHLEIVKKEEEIVSWQRMDGTLKESEEFPRNHLQRCGLRKLFKERVLCPRASKMKEPLPQRGSKGKREKAIPRTWGRG